MRVLDLFSGIGGFSLGLERAGMRTVAFCEIDPFCRAILRRHWPAVPAYEDVRTLTGDRLRADGIDPEVICGGFPCQDISTAGKGAGIEGERSGLWRDYARIIGEVRPRYVIVENVSALLNRGLDKVLGDLAALGFDAEWHCIPASAVGAPHRRDRVWIMAYAIGNGWQSGRTDYRGDDGAVASPGGEDAALADAEIIPERSGLCAHEPGGKWRGRSGDSGSERDLRHAAYIATLCQGIRRGDAAGQWWTEPDVGRVAHGVPARVDRLRALGNAVVPQIPQIIGEAIMAAETTR